jgi:hypothetical protein
MPELQVNVRILGLFGQCGSVGRFRLNQLSAILQHISVLDPNVGTLRGDSEHRSIPLCRVCVAPRVTTLIGSPSQPLNQSLSPLQTQGTYQVPEHSHVTALASGADLPSTRQKAGLAVMMPATAGLRDRCKPAMPSRHRRRGCLAHDARPAHVSSRL